MNNSRRTALKTSLFGLGVAGLAAAAPRLLIADSTAGDMYTTSNGEISIHPVSHASFVIKTPNGVVYVDPVGGAEKYSDLPGPDLIMVTHHHGDHLDLPTLEGLVGDNTMLITNPTVMESLTGAVKQQAKAIGNGDSAEALDIAIEAVPAYNITADRLKYHPKGRDNGYVLTIDGSRVYVGGDTEAVPEMRGLENIDIAFIPMNDPYTMGVDQAAEGVLEFAPKVVYPYHHKGSDINEFEKLVNAGGKTISVVKANWYG